MSNAIIQQGRFISNGLNKTLSIRSDVDWMTVYNETSTIQNVANRPTNFYWQRGMAAGRGLKVVKMGAVGGDFLTNGQTAANAGFTLVNQGSDAVVSAGVAFTAISNAVQPVVSTGDTSLLQVGDVVRLSQPVGGFDATALDGIDWQISAINPNVSFTIAGVLPNVVGAGTAGTWRKVNISSIFYPQTRYIINITTANPLFPIVTTSVDHGYVVGQEVRFHVSQVVMGNAYGMTQIDNIVAPITAVTANTFTVSLDTTGFGVFAFPTSANYFLTGGITPAYVGPVGEDTATALNAIPQANILSDATVNTAIIGMALGAGTAAGVDVGPAGEANDVIYWVAGKSFSVLNI